MKLCYWCDSGNIEFFSKLGKEFEKEGWESIYVMLDEYDTNSLTKYRTEAKTYNLTEFIRAGWNGFTKDKLTKYQCKYTDINFWEIYYSDRHLSKYNYENGIKFIIGHIEFFENLYSVEKPNGFVYETTDNITAYLALEIGRYYGVKYLGAFADSLDYKMRMTLADNAYFKNSKMEKLYFSSIEFTNSDYEEAEKLIEKVSNPNNRPAYMETHTRAPRLKLSFATDIAKFLIRKFQKRFNDKFCYINYRNYKLHLYPITRYLNYRQCRKYFKQPVDGDKYYVFPLHYQPEVTSSVWASKYENQLFLIDSIAKSIPIDCMLYVKEHYGGLGCRNKLFYDQLKKYKNVRLIDPFINIHELIDNAAATIVLTNTTGLECILRRKPLFICGNVYYDFFDEAVKIKDIFDERQKLYNPKQMDEKKVLRFVVCYLKSFYNGYINPQDSANLDDGNIKAFVYAIKDSLGI